MTDSVPMTEEQMRDAQQALDIAAINGVLSLAIMLKKRDLMTAEEGASLYDSMSKPLAMGEVANNPIVQNAQHNLDLLFAEILRPR